MTQRFKQHRAISEFSSQKLLRGSGGLRTKGIMKLDGGVIFFFLILFNKNCNRYKLKVLMFALCNSEGSYACLTLFLREEAFLKKSV